MRRVLVLLLLGVLAACAPKPEVAAIAACEAQPDACGAAAQTLCERGGAGHSALLAAAPDLETASPALAALVFEHALCSAPDDASPERVARVVASLDDTRLGRLGGFSPGLHYRLFTAAVQAGLEPPLPTAPKDPALHGAWCRDVLPIAAQRARAHISAMAPLLAVDCGDATDGAITAVVTALEAPVLRAWAALEATHGADRAKIEAGMAAHRIQKRRAQLSGQASFGVFWVSLVDRVGETKQPWRWLEPVFGTPLTCGSLNTSMVEWALRRPGWAAAGRAGLAKGLAAHYARCPDDSGLWPLVLERLGPEGQPLTDQLFALGGPCTSLAARAGTLRKITQWSLNGRAAALPNAATQAWLQQQAGPAWAAAFRAFEADARRRCPGVLH